MLFQLGPADSNILLARLVNTLYKILSHLKINLFYTKLVEVLLLLSSEITSTFVLKGI